MKKIWILLVLIFFVVVVWVGSIYGIEYIVKNPSDRGVFGDQFGAINALFSGLAFSGLFYTIYLQHIEIKQTQKDMKEQNDSITLQRFETSFFSILSQYNEIVSNSQIVFPDNSSLSGKIAIITICKDFDSLKNYSLQQVSNSEQVWSTEINKQYEITYSKYYSFLGIYYRTLYRLFVFLDESSIENKKMYSDIVRSQLSDDELCLLFFNGVSDKGKNFKKYIEKYSLLNNLPIEIIGTDIRKIYRPEAFF